jgi:DNA helicase-2/ATP-dependent DNA helicase PcrA
VIRAKSHGAILKMLADRQSALATWARRSLDEAVGQMAGGSAALAIWDAAPPGTPVDQRVTALSRWVRDATLEPFLRSTLESIGPRLRARTRDVVGEWSAFWTDRVGLGEAFAKHAPGLFSEGQLDEIHRWCTTRERMRLGGKDALPEGEVYGLDAEDDALLLRLYQMQRGPLEGPKGPLAYEHLMVDEVQDFSPVELAVLLEATTRQRSITLAGDTAQAIAPEHGFSDWATMLDALGVPHEKVEPLRVSYRSTREIVEAAEHVLGPLIGDLRPVVPRTGTPVEAFGFASAGEAAEFLSHALKELLRNEPTAAVALIARHPEQARLYYEGLVRAEVPSLRWVARQDFSFTAGIDVTDVRQTKGLEFDVVVLLEAGEASYPMNDDARRLLHVAMTRAAHQLWVTYVGRPSPLLPDSLRL